MTAMDKLTAQSPFRLDDFPVLDIKDAEIEETQLVALSNRDVRSRGFNLLRTTLTKRLARTGSRMFGLTSATPAAGKTFLSINLAASLSRVSEDPDLDLRMASVARVLDLNTEKGIEQCLIDPDCGDLRNFGVRMGETNLVVFPAARVREGSAELVSGTVFRDFIAELRARTGNAYVLFDLPPAFANDDAMLSVDHLDGYILVADGGKTTKSQVKDLLRVMDPSPCLGTILNRYKGGFADSYGYGYGGDSYESYYR